MACPQSCMNRVPLPDDMKCTLGSSSSKVSRASYLQHDGISEALPTHASVGEYLLNASHLS